MGELIKASKNSREEFRLFSGCIILGELLNISVLRFPHL